MSLLTSLKHLASPPESPNLTTQAALNVAADIDWTVCDSNSSFGYRRDYADERTVIYPTLIEQAKIDVLIYNGEADLCVPYTDNGTSASV